MTAQHPVSTHAAPRRATTTPGTTPGSFAPRTRPEAALALAPEALPVHSEAHRGIVTTYDDDGVLIARNTAGGSLPCPHCRLPDGSGQDEAKQALCAPCAGRGHTTDVPFCEREWDRVLDTESGGRLFLGGHDCQPGGGDCQPEDKFDLVVSLYYRPGHDPAPGVEHHSHTLVDGPLNPASHARIDELATMTVESLQRGESVLVRCQAGMNRSGLVAGLAMVKMGWSTDEVLARMRAERGPWVLFNTGFVAHLRAHEASLPTRS